MSEYVPRDILPELWEEILKRHWTFLETEESLQKLEERKKLEGCLKEFLCIVPHDRKFFLPETAHVLRKTILELDDFTAYKAILGFEAISQYANNLFTKPWRKEYRVIKMYSGFFQHEVKANLLDYVKLFEAMGYRQVSSEVLELDGPICPDQVTNVSRDAMAAYVECQIMKHIYSGVASLGLSCTWQDVFRYRETHTGGSTQAVKGFACSLQELRFGKEKSTKSENTYASIQHGLTAATTALQTMSKCQNCAPFHHQLMHHLPPQQQQQQQQQHLFNGQCAVHSNNNINNNNGCALHANNNNLALQPAHSLYNDNNSKLLASYPAANYQQHAFVAPGIHHHEAHAHGHLMPHSRSLEHYSEPAPPLLPHRHSFDQHPQGCMAHPHPHHYQYPQSQHVYESPYDCIDGLSMDSSSGGGGGPSYAAVGGPSNYSTAYAHPYNVSGNRYPLPYNISNQLNSHYDTPAACNGGAVGDHLYADDYGNSDPAKYTCNYHPTAMQQQQQQGSGSLAARHHFSKEYQVNRQLSFPPDLHHLIDFDDCARLTDHDFHAQLHTRSQNNSFDYERERERCERMVQHRGTGRLASSAALAADLNRLSLNPTYAQPKDAIGGKIKLQQQQCENVDGNYVYSKPGAKGADNLSSGGAVSEQQRCGQRYARDDAVAIKTTDKYLRNPDNQDEFIEFNRKMHKELNGQRAAAGADHHLINGRQNNTSEGGAAAALMSDRETTDASYESSPFDGSRTESAARTQRSPTQAIKNQDGVGSFESWNYVFQNLDRSSYSKDKGERGDLLVESLHLDSLNGPSTSTAAANGSVDKRRSSHVVVAEGSSKATGRSMNGGDKSQYKQEQLVASAPTEKRLETAKSGSANVEKSILKQSKSNNASSNSAIAVGKTKIKSALKSTLKTTTSNVNNNNNDNHVQQQQHQNKTSQKNYNQSAKRQPIANRVVKQPPLVATQVIITSPNEWSCRFCTFLNPDTKRICEMCCRSKDFNVDAVAVKNTPTCV